MEKLINGGKVEKLRKYKNVYYFNENHPKIRYVL